MLGDVEKKADVSSERRAAKDTPHYRRLSEQLATRFDPKRPDLSDKKQEPAADKDRDGERSELDLTWTAHGSPWLKAAAIALMLVVGGSWFYLGHLQSGSARLPTEDRLAQALQEERDKAAALTRELDSAWRALRVQAMELADKTGEVQELDDLRQALRDAESQSASYQDLLARERLRNLDIKEQLAVQQSAPIPRLADSESPPEQVKPQVLVLEKPVTTSPAISNNQASLAAATPASATPAPAPETMPHKPASAELTRLMERAHTLLEQGNIAAARIVLERAAETRSGAALFALAETYDPAVLSAWGTFGTQGDSAKARELYTQALSEGVQQAMDRMNSLR
jgi:hypothetical protein